MTDKIDNREIFLRGEHVVLKVLTRNDVINSGWFGWFNDQQLCETLQKHYFPNSIESQLFFLENNIQGSMNKLQLGICRIEGGPIVGVISLNDIDFINRKAEISVVIGERKAQNVKFFIDACRLILGHAFYSLNLNRIYGASISKDLVAAMCRMLNCSEEGVKRQEIYKNGSYHDAYCYGILRQEFDS
jgi:RimJ/RimL family protein N-acetyltransferase